METTVEQRIEQGEKMLDKLDIYAPYVVAFKKEQIVCFFENFGGYFAFQDSELQNKIQEFEKQYRGTIFAVTHEFTEFGELYSFLFIPEEKEEWDMVLEDAGETELGGKKYYTFAYVWNKTEDAFSEFGSIMIETFGGGIRRIG